ALPPVQPVAGATPVHVSVFASADKAVRETGYARIALSPFHTLTVSSAFVPQVIRIRSFDDPRVAVFRNVRDADMRGRDKLLMAESELVLRRLLRMPQRLHSMLLSTEKFERMRPALADLPDSAPVHVAEL